MIIQHGAGSFIECSHPAQTISSPAPPDNQHAGPARILLSCPLGQGRPAFYPGRPAPSILRRIWRKSPYCPESPKHGTVVRVNGRWVHTEKGRGD